MARSDDAWNAHDPDSLAGLFVADGTLVTPDGRLVEGRAALRELYASPGPTKQTTSTSELVSVKVIGDGLAVIDATQTLRGPGVELLGASEARLFAVIRESDDGWRFVAARPSVPGRATR